MAQKKNNHIIPKCLIKEWSTTNEKMKGVYVYNLKKDKIYFSSASGARGFSFAIEPYFYVPSHNNGRIYKVEEWLSGIEHTLAIFIKAMKSAAENESLLRSQSDFMKFLLALFSLKNRTKYGVESIKRFLLSNPDFKKLISSEENDNIDIVVLENLINSTTEDANAYSNCEIKLFKTENGLLILGDRPVVHNLEGYSFVPLGPNYVLSIRQAPQLPTYERNDNLTDDMIDIFNKWVAQQSRYWIVSNDRRQIEKYISICKEPKPNEQPQYTPVKHLVHGYKLD
jgi:hypothetical protein